MNLNQITELIRYGKQAACVNEDDTFAESFRAVSQFSHHAEIGFPGVNRVQDNPLHVHQVTKCGKFVWLVKERTPST